MRAIIRFAFRHMRAYVLLYAVFFKVPAMLLVAALV